VKELTPELLGLAEDANTYTPLRPGEERIELDRYVLWMSASSGHAVFTVAQRLRLADDTWETDVEEVRALCRERARVPFTWEVGTHATPPDLADQFLEAGMLPFDEPLAIGMVMTEPPEGGPAAGVEVRAVDAPEQLVAAHRIARVGFGMEPEDDDLDEAARDLASQRELGTWVSYLAYVDGRPVAQAQATFTPHGVVMNGGSTLPDARGRGAYRALVRARWEAAAERGTPALVTQAGAMSRPILERLGFRAVCEIRILLDDPDGVASSR
jgi:GNAT superfamily N-acetyltransferase